ncbi:MULTISPECIES: hypothetical protein [unclassified Xanthomonas]|uniref:hypothetical protein n=1 Tax=unclassified Xanthomonas TaxID=2643310 RepID=UPI002A803D1B|nr:MULTISPECIES: hypothetical protein [unclassified Xanthomonas]MDY4297534.1 hypothetical protein [Xanthomonas sp. LF02-5]MDY4359328.1 hypothetical protein [Xanthomonas sp. LF04-12]
MNDDVFDGFLRAWGYAYGPAREAQEAGAGMYGACTLAGLGRPSLIRQQVNMDRGGLDRRRAMGRAAGMVAANGQARLLPTWAAEPVRFAETRTAHAKILSSSDGIPEQAAKVERAVLQLHRESPSLARVIRAEYCTFGRQSEKAKTFGMERKAYRERLAEARGWVRCDLARTG